MFSTLSASATQYAIGVTVALVVLLAVVIYLILHLRTKRFYFVRHGKTVLNTKRIRQGAEGGLAESGIRQANAVGTYLKKVGVQKIIASPYERARQTAEIINTYLQTPISYTPLLAERRNPSDVIGKSAEDPHVEQVMDLVDLSFHDDNFRYSDEENFADLKKRARDCLSYLESTRGTVFCVVTHSVFLKMTLSYLLYRENLHAPDYVKLSFYNPADNGGVTVCEYSPLKAWFSKTHGWSIVAYNEVMAI